MKRLKAMRILLVYILVLGIALIGTVEPSLAQDTIKMKSFESVDQLSNFYQQTGYSTDDILEGEYVLVDELPDDFADVKSIERRKKLFVRVILPLVYLENSRIKKEREIVRDYFETRKDSDRTAETKEVKTRGIKDVFQRYEINLDRLNPKTIETIEDTVFRRVSTVPPSLVTAQAVVESGWGTSRFTLKGNNLFGQRTYGDNPEGLNPKGIDKPVDFRVKVFPNLLESVRSYMLNLNTHWAYREFRKLREEKASRGLKLIGGLEKYSERRGNYLETLRTLIQSNDFTKYDRVEF